MRTILRKYLTMSSGKINFEDKKLSYLYKKHIDHSLMAYKLFASSLHNPLDPFYTKVENRKDILKHLHIINDRSNKHSNIDFMEYNFISSIDLLQNHVYMVNNQIKVYGLPLYFKENQIAFVSIIDDEFQMNKNILNDNGVLEIYAFTGLTGAAKNNPNQNQKSILGYISFHRKTKNLTISFRGSRSGDPVSALIKALLFSNGNADWVTDMEIFNTKWNLKIEDFLNVYKKIFTSIKGIDISYGFAKAFATTVENIKCIIQVIKDEYKAISSISITGHSLGGALAQVCYLCFKFGVLNQKELIGNCKIYCFPFSAPPILTKSSIVKLNLLDEYQVIHSYLDSDLVHMINLDNKIKAKLLKMCVKIKGTLSIFQNRNQELAHFGVNFFKFSTELYKEKIDFPKSHEYEIFYTIIPFNKYLPAYEFKKLDDIKNNKRLNYIECIFHIINNFDFDIIRDNVQFIGLQKKIDISNILKQINNANAYYKKIDPNNAMTFTNYIQIEHHIRNIIIEMKKQGFENHILILKIYCEAIRECIL